MKEKKNKKIAKTQKKFPVWAIVLICAVAGLIIAGIVCFVLIKVGEADDLRKAQEITDRILETRADVTAFLDTKVDAAELTDENKETLANFEEAIEKAGDALRELGEKQAVKEGEAKSKFENASNELGNLQEVAEVEQLLMDVTEDGAISDEEIEQLAGSGNEYLKTLATDYKEYRTKVAEFNEKYADLKGKKKTELDADYAEIQQYGNELAKKYASIEFADVHGMSRDDILKFYATIEELKNYFAEKN